jgi:hypothetical protein
MNSKVYALFQQEVGEVEPEVCVCSKARIDTGMWLRRSPMWLCIVGADLIMLSISRRRYFVRKAISACAKSYYNHSTGEFVIEPGEELRFKKFPMTPKDALSLLKYLKKDQIN